MSDKPKKYRVEKPGGGYEHETSSSDFYASGPGQRPLTDTGAPSDARSVHRTGKHQPVSTRAIQKIDPRERMALIAILKLIILAVSLLAAFFLLKKGIHLYEESIWIEKTAQPKLSPVLQNVKLIEDFNIEDQESMSRFSERVIAWRDAERLVSSADALMKRHNYDEAITQCQDALRKDPAHMGALQRLGALYYTKGSYVEAVNAYIRLLSVDPSSESNQKELIRALSAYGDHEAVKYMAGWYLEANLYDLEVQRYLAQALYALEDYRGAAGILEKVVAEQPADVVSLEQLASVYMELEEYERALIFINNLREKDRRNKEYFRKMAICHAQLGHGQETVQVLVRLTQLHGPQVTLALVQDPLFTPVHADRAFQSYIEQVGGEDFRLGIEELAYRSAAQAADQQEEGMMSQERTLEDEALLDNPFNRNQ